MSGLWLVLLGGCGADDPVAACVDCDPVATAAEVCGSGLDDDGDGWVDCADADCDGQCAEVDDACADGRDNDGDGSIDCADSDCGPVCGEGDCTDQVDGDLDGLADCVDPDCAWLCDADGDGWRALAQGGPDCDDHDAAVRPDGNEVCNGTDDDCDGLVDDDDDSVDLQTGTPTFLDRDLDGFGGGDPVLPRCATVPGISFQGGDCDDLAPAVFPGAPEVCNGIDDDCNLLRDDDDPGVDPGTQATWWRDDDGDGLGDGGAPLVTCEAHPWGYVPNDLDCDDTDGAIGGPTDWYNDGDGDGFGAGAPLGVPSCQAPPGAVGQGVEDCDDTDRHVFPGALEVCGDGLDQSCDSYDPDCHDFTPGSWDVDDAHASVQGRFDDDRLGSCVRLVDHDQDGFDDLVVGAYANDDAGSISGAAYLFRGPLDGDLGVDAADATVVGVAGDWMTYQDGCELGADLDGDGNLDAALGARGSDPSGTYSGAVHLLRGPLVGSYLAQSDTVATLTGGARDDSAGYVVRSAGDVDRDGFDDLLVGGPGANLSGRGKAWLVLGPALDDGALDAVSHTTFTGEGTRDNLGMVMVAGEDVDGDGRPDLLLGAPNHLSGQGAAHLFTQPPGGTVDAGLADARFTGGRDDGCADALDPADMDGDGLADVVVGCASSDRVANVSGEVHIRFAAGSGAYAFPDDSDATFFGTQEGGWMGNAVATGDVNADGAVDVWVGTPWADNGVSGQGMVSLFLGPVSGQHSVQDAWVTWTTTVSRGNLGDAVAGGGDVNADGYDDIVLSRGSGAGTAFLFYGASP